jgi:hypothetical protein
MGKKLLLILILFSAINLANSQNINGVLIDASNTANRDQSAAFEVNANTGGGLKGGFLMPRVALTGTADVTTISGTEATSLMVYNDGTGGLTPAGFYYWNGSAWTLIATGSGSGLFTAGTGLSWSGTTLNSTWTRTGTTLSPANAGDNVVIASTSAATIVEVLKGAASQTGDLLQFQNSAATVLASVSSNGTVKHINGLATTPGITFQADVNTGIFGTGSDVLGFSTAGAERARFDASGNFGIGVSPSGTYKLQVSGKLLTSGIDENSDVRLKKDITPIDDALHKVMEMRGVTYNWRKDEFPDKQLEKGIQYGLIAQELEKIIPELVTTDAAGWKAIEYSHLVPVLIEAIKELSVENSGLKASLNNVLTRLTVLENIQETKASKSANK